MPEVVEVDGMVRYKYLVKRAKMLVKWETIPPPFREWDEIQAAEVSVGGYYVLRTRQRTNDGPDSKEQE